MYLIQKVRTNIHYVSTLHCTTQIHAYLLCFHPLFFWIGKHKTNLENTYSRKQFIIVNVNMSKYTLGERTSRIDLAVGHTLFSFLLLFHLSVCRLCCYCYSSEWTKTNHRRRMQNTILKKCWKVRHLSLIIWSNGLSTGTNG